MQRSSLVALLCAGMVLPASVAAQREREAATQVRELPKEPPAVVTAETQRLVFHVSSLTARGLLSQQARNTLNDLFRRNRRTTIVKLRAFVAGGGDVRRVQAIVSEAFTRRRLPLPVLTVVQVGELPLAGAQVVFESVSVSRDTVNPHGLAFISGQAASSETWMTEMDPLAEESLAGLRTAVQAAGSSPEDVLRVTCFLTSLADIHAVRKRVAGEFPKAAANYVQIQRAPRRSLAECEAVARLRSPLEQTVRLLNPDGLPKSPNYSQVALIAAPRIVLSGAQLAFRYQEDDARLAFKRLEKELEQAGTSLSRVVWSSIYPLSSSIGELVRKVRFDFYDRANPPASTMLPFEDLPALDASFALDVVAVPVNSQ